MANESLNAWLSQRIDVTPDLAIFRIVPDGWELPDFTPGQFVTIGLPESAPRYTYSDAREGTPNPDNYIRRAYSVASSSKQKEYLELYITLVKSGELTPRLWTLQSGDRLWLNPKVTGMFTLKDVPPGKNIVMIATGTGLAPYMSMLRTDLECGGPQKVAVLLGARHSWDLGYRSELFTIQRMCSNFTFIPTVSRPAQETIPWNGQAGYVQDLWKDRHIERAWGFAPTPHDTHVLLCGNPAMIVEMLELLDTQGFREHKRKTPGQVHAEKYW